MNYGNWHYVSVIAIGAVISFVIDDFFTTVQTDTPISIEAGVWAIFAGGMPAQPLRGLHGSVKVRLNEFYVTS
jgi:hypothetical protein